MFGRGHSSQNRNVVVLLSGLLIVAGLAFVAILRDNAETPIPQNMTKTFRIALTYVKQTSNFSSPSIEIDEDTLNKFVDMVENDINEYCRVHANDTRFDFQTYSVIYTRQDEHPGLPEIRAIKEDGISLMVGHDTSMLIDGAYDYANKNGVLMLSPSGGIFFANEDDLFLTLMPSWGAEDEALASLMRSRGYNAFVALISGGGGSQLAVDHLTQLIGFNESDSIILFDANSKDLSQETKLASDKLVELEQRYGVGHVCIVAAPNFFSPAEAAVFLDAVETFPNLSGVPWFDVSGVPHELIAMLPIAVAKYEFIRAIPSIASGARFNDFMTMYQKQVSGSIPQIQLYLQAARHDAMWMLALSVMSVNSTEPEAVKGGVLEISRSYKGVLGNCTLNEYGSREFTDCEIYRWVNDSGILEMRLIGNYTVSHGEASGFQPVINKNMIGASPIILTSLPLIEQKYGKKGVK